MTLTLIALAALAILVGVEYTFLIMIFAVLIYMHPVKAILGLAFLLFLRYIGNDLKAWFKSLF